MPFTIIRTLLLFAIGVIIIANVAIPLINPRYPMFWMFRKRGNDYEDAVRELEKAKVKKSIKEIYDKTESIGKDLKSKKNKTYKDK